MFFYGVLLWVWSHRPVGRCSKVWCEKEMIEQAEWDFSEVSVVGSEHKLVGTVGFLL